MTASGLNGADRLTMGAESFVGHLAEANLLAGGDVARLHAARDKSPDGLVRLVSKLGLLEESVVADHLAKFLGLPRVAMQDLPGEALLTEAISEAFLQEALVLPIAATGDEIILAVADPFARYPVDAVRLACGRPVRLAIAEPSMLARALDALHATSPADPAAVAATFDEEREEDFERLRDLAAEAPVIRMVNALIERAVEMRASDIHIEPFRHDLVVRFRIDGLLRAVEAPPPAMRAALVSRIKLMGRLNIAERRLPQDGRVRVAVRGKEIDLRLSTFPTMHDESVVLRILDKGAVSLDLARLGLEGPLLARTLEMLAKPTGIVLVTGPTGSGKTTTLYAALVGLAKPETKVVTVEDPIEYELPGLNQTQVKPQIGLTFANALRSLLRQDPDVVLIGEIRDRDTAEIAAQAALTGHKVLSTLHTNDAASSVTRLLDMGLPAFLVTATLEAVIAQRLVRVLCAACKRAAPVPSEAANVFARLGGEAPATYHEPHGCERCDGTGFKGRTGIYEVLLMSDGLRRQVHDGGDARALHAAAASAGMTTLYEDGMLKAGRGLTTVSEVLRVTREA